MQKKLIQEILSMLPIRQRKRIKGILNEEWI
jgi:hypothetical protein